jgi:hypothetical protein
MIPVACPANTGDAMSYQLAKMIVLVDGKRISDAQLLRVEAITEAESRDQAIVTVSDIEFSATKFRNGQSVEIKLHDQASIFKGTIFSLQPRYTAGGAEAVILCLAGSPNPPLRVPVTLPVPGYPRHFQFSDQQVQRLEFRLTSRNSWNGRAFLHTSMNDDYSRYTVGSSVQIKVSGKDYQGVIRRVEQSAARTGSSQFIVDLTGATP